MNIFGIIFIGALLGLLMLGVIELIFLTADWYESIVSQVIAISLGIIIWVSSVFIGIGIFTHNERMYVERFKAEKMTIESSLNVEELSGLERATLVTKAAELNGELSERKARYNTWLYVTYDKDIYNGVDLIKFKEE